MRLIVFGDSNAAAIKATLLSLNLHWLEMIPSLEHGRENRLFRFSHLILRLWNVPYNEDFRDSLAQITIAKQSQNLSGAIREH